MRKIYTPATAANDVENVLKVPPEVEYRLTEWGQTLCPTPDALLKWAEQKEHFSHPAEQNDQDTAATQ